MSHHFDLEEENDWIALSESLNARSIKGQSRGQKQNVQSKLKQAPVSNQPVEKQSEEDQVTFTYKASRYEAGWLEQSLGEFYEEQWIQDVLRMVKGGKEASVYQCLASISVPEIFLAAKVYRPRQFRNLKNDHLYRAGREALDENGHVIHDSRATYAMQKKSSFGLQLTHVSWIEHEVKTMQILHEAGADTPKPYASGKNAILMSFIGDAGQAAPTLNEVNLSHAEAARLFDRVVFNLELMLSMDRIHADLSAYNILYWEEDIMMIDFPQAIHPHQNPNAWPIFQRDVARVCQYFQRQGVDYNADQLARDLWKKYKLEFSPDIDSHFSDTENLDEHMLLEQTNASELGL
jgi:RIO kinase 1